MAGRMISARDVTRCRKPPHGSRDAGGDTSGLPWPRASACMALPSGLGRAAQGHADWRVLAASHVASQRCWYEDTGAEHDLCITPDALFFEQRPEIMRQCEHDYGRVRACISRGALVISLDADRAFTEEKSYESCMVDGAWSGRGAPGTPSGRYPVSWAGPGAGTGARRRGEPGGADRARGPAS